MIFALLIISTIPLIAGVAGLRISFNKKALNYLLSFSGAFLISTAFTHLIPEVYHHEENHSLVSVLILAGFFAQILLENLSQGIEHGHFHNNDCSHRHNLPIVMFISLFIHSFVEGGVLDEEFFHEEKSLLLISTSIAIHKIPVAFALMVLLKSTIQKKGILFLFLGAFSLSSLVGYFVFQQVTFIPHSYIIAFIAGMFLHVATTILFEVSPGHKFETKRLLIAVLGALLAFLPEII